MSEDELVKILQDGFPGDKVTVGGDGHHFETRIISDKFEGLKLLDRHKLVYSFVDDRLKNGSLHALNIHAVTTSEWQNING